MRHDPTVRAPDDPSEQQLFTMFAPASYEDWRRAAEQTLKGVPFEKRLITRTYEGLQLQPLYDADAVAHLPQLASLPGEHPFLRGTSTLGYLIQPWHVAQELPYPTAAAVNQAARADLPRGLMVLHVPLDQATLRGLDPDQAPTPLVGQGGASLASVADLLTLLDGIDLTQTPLQLAAGGNALPLLALLLAALTERGSTPDQLHGCLTMDPLGALATQGSLSTPLPQIYADMATLTNWAATHAPDLRTIEVAAHAYHNAGASAVQDLACALATGVAYLRAMQTHGLTVDLVAPRMQFAFSIGAPFFIEIARLRAARMLWARIVAAFGGSEQAQQLTIHARTSAWTKSRADAYNNMLRATSEAFAAVMGGCASLHVSPFDEALGLPDEFSRRIARNVQIILREECSFGRLVDPSGGSWAVERLTDELAREAWTLFQELERRGGMAAALAEGFPQAQIAATRTERLNQIALRREVIVGVNMYANLKEHPVTARQIDTVALQAERRAELARYRTTADSEALQTALATLTAATDEQLLTATLAAARAGATLGALVAARATQTGPQVEPLPAQRGAEQFEALRRAAEAYAVRNGAPPAVFLAAMGGQSKARADFATSFFEAGGFAVTGGSGYATPTEAAQAAQASGASIVVICTTDEAYPTLVPALAALIKADRPDTTLVLAGYPADQITTYQAAGIDEFIHLRADCYAILARLQQLKGVTQ